MYCQQSFTLLHIFCARSVYIHAYLCLKHRIDQGRNENILDIGWTIFHHMHRHSDSVLLALIDLGRLGVRPSRPQRYHIRQSRKLNANQSAAGGRIRSALDCIKVQIGWSKAERMNERDEAYTTHGSTRSGRKKDG